LSCLMSVIFCYASFTFCSLLIGFFGNSFL